MKEKFIECGKIVSTHGIKGMIRVNPWSDTPEFLNDYKRLFVGKDKIEYKITSSAAHKNITLIKLKNIDTIEQAQPLIGSVVYINREDSNLEDGRYFISDLIGCQVFDFETNTELGFLSDVTALAGANDVWTVKQGENEYLVPVIDEVVKEIDVDNNRIIIKPLKGIFDDEN